LSVKPSLKKSLGEIASASIEIKPAKALKIAERLANGSQLVIKHKPSVR